MQQQFEGGVYRAGHAHAYTASIISLFVCTYDVRAHTYMYVVDPTPCGDIVHVCL